jgi:hypothetical protein
MTESIHRDRDIYHGDPVPPLHRDRDIYRVAFITHRTGINPAHENTDRGIVFNFPDSDKVRDAIGEYSTSEFFRYVSAIKATRAALHTEKDFYRKGGTGHEYTFNR